MRKIFLFIVIITTISCKAQSPIVDIDNWDGDSQANAYYKDINNYFNDGKVYVCNGKSCKGRLHS